MRGLRCKQCSTAHTMRFQAILLVVAVQTAQGLLRSALVSPGKAVSVSIEYSGAADAIDELSQELRKAKAATIWCDNVDAVKCFADEQATAKGDFPGPLPVVYDGTDRQAAIDAGAAAVVADAGDDVGDAAPVIWRVTAANAADAVVSRVLTAARSIVQRTPSPMSSVWVRSTPTSPPVPSGRRMGWRPRLPCSAMPRSCPVRWGRCWPR